MKRTWSDKLPQFHDTTGCPQKLFQPFAKLSPSQPASLQLSWAEIALLSELRGIYTLHPPGIVVLTCSSLIFALFMTYSWPVKDLFMTCSWVVHGLFMTCSWPVASCSWLVHNLFMTCSQLVHHLFLHCSWLVHDLSMTCSWLFLGLFKACSWLLIN